jgi:hypothetical protein
VTTRTRALLVSHSDPTTASGVAAEFMSGAVVHLARLQAHD